LGKKKLLPYRKTFLTKAEKETPDRENGEGRGPGAQGPKDRLELDDTDII